MDFKDLKEALKPLLRNKYVITVVLFVVWMTFLDGDDIFRRYELEHKLDKLKKERAELIENNENTRRKIDELKSNREKLEKFAREEYIMKKDNEVVYIIKKK